VNGFNVVYQQMIQTQVGFNDASKPKYRYHAADKMMPH